MTGENRRKNIAIEVARGDEALREAEQLLSASMPTGAVSRAYFAAFHFARALLLSLGEEVRSHRGVVQLLHRDLVREGKLDANVASLLAQLQRFRQDADYSAEVVFTPEIGARELSAARTFVQTARELLARGGWLAQGQ
jgi:uncharacterized protein (UPF0332 family)